MKLKLKHIENQVVVILGSSTDIGRETAIQFAKRGAKVAVAASSKESLSSLVQELEQHDAHVIGFVADSCDKDQVQKVAEGTFRRFGRIDTWVHVSSQSLYGKFEETSEEEFVHMMDTNTLGPARSAWAALPYLKQQGGSLIVVTSVTSRVSGPFNSAYSASKHAAEGFIESLRVELKHEDAPVNLVNILPGPTFAGLTKTRKSKGRKARSIVPLSVYAFQKPKIVAKAILHCATHPERDFIIGARASIMILIHKLSPQVTENLSRLFFRFTRSYDDELPEKPHEDADDDSMYYSPPGSETNSIIGDWNVVQKTVSDKVSRHKKAVGVGALSVCIGLPALVAIFAKIGDYD